MANEVSKAAVYGTDISDEAIALAKKNAKRLGLRARFRQGDLFGALPKKLRGGVDVITLHPPYVASGEMADLPDEIREWEPVHTLTDRSDDGLGLIRRTVDEAPVWLRRRGWLLIETDPDGARDVTPIYRRGGFRDVEITKDRVAQGDPRHRGTEPEMSEPTVAPFGAWHSPISAEMLVEGGVRLGHVSIEGRLGVSGRGPDRRKAGDPSWFAAIPGPSRWTSHPQASTRRPPCTSTGAAHPGSSWRRLLVQLRRSTALPTGAGPRADADHAGHRRTFPVRGRSCDGGQGRS